MRVHTFPKTICPKVNLIMQLEFELVYYVIKDRYVSHNTTKTLPCIIVMNLFFWNLCLYVIISCVTYFNLDFNSSRWNFSYIYIYMRERGERKERERAKNEGRERKRERLTLKSWGTRWRSHLQNEIGIFHKMSYRRKYLVNCFLDNKCFRWLFSLLKMCWMIIQFPVRVNGFKTKKIHARYFVSRF